MQNTIILLLLILAIESDKPTKIEDFRWKNRLVLFFQEEGSFTMDFSDSLSSAIEDRKIVLFHFHDSFSSNVEVDFQEEYIQYLQKKYQMGAKGNCWILIGLDGGIKMRKEDDLDWKVIFKTVDAMPMRQSELRRNY